MVLNFNKLTYFIIFTTLIIASIFTDLPIYDKTVTHSLVIFIAPLFFLLILIFRDFKLTLSSNARIFLTYAIVTFFVSLFYVLYFAIIKANYYAYDKNIFIKLLEAFTSLTILHFLVYILLFSALTKLRLNTIKKIIISVFIFLNLVAVIEYFNPDLLNIFHTFPKNYDRLRLLAMEPSHAIVIYSVFAFLSVALFKSKFLKIISIIIILIASIFIGSKGFFISVLLSLFVMFFKNFHKLKFIPIYLILFLIAFYLFINIALPSLIASIENFSSFATRFSALISSFVILITNPLGLGYGTYLISYPEILDNSYKIANSLFLNFFNLNLAYYEIDAMISTGKSLGAKAGIPQSIMFNGWIGLIFWFLIFKNSLYYIKNLNISIANKKIFEFLIIFLFIQLFIGSEYTLLYVVWLPLALIESMYFKQRRMIT